MTINFRLFVAAINRNIGVLVCSTNIHYQDVCNKLLNIIVFFWKKVLPNL